MVLFYIFFGFCVLFLLLWVFILYQGLSIPDKRVDVTEDRQARAKWANEFYKEEEDYYYQRVTTADEMLRTGKISMNKHEQLINEAKKDLEQARKTAFRY